MRRKLLAVTLAVIMVFTTMSAAVFAEEGQKAYPNLIASAYVENYDCIHGSDADVSLKISKDGMTDIIIPLAYDKEAETYFIEDTVEGIDSIITDIKDDYDAMLDTMSDEEIAAGNDADSDILKKMGYSVEVIIKDTGDGHKFTVTEISSSVLTYKSVTVVTDWLAALLIGMMVEEFTEEGDTEALAELDRILGGHVTVDKDGNVLVGDDPATFDHLLKAIENNDEVKAEMSEEDMAAINEYKAMIAALENGSYNGELIIDVSLGCDCPEMAEYNLCHDYYNSDGEFIGQVSGFQKAEVGSVVKIDDIKFIEKYDGVEYEVEGVYLIDEKTGEVDYTKPVEEYTIPGEEGYLEVVVKYVSDEKSAAAGTAEPEGNGKSPDTGDDFNALPFTVVMLLAALGMGAAVVRRRA